MRARQPTIKVPFATRETELFVLLHIVSPCSPLLSPLSPKHIPVAVTDFTPAQEIFVGK